MSASQQKAQASGQQRATIVMTGGHAGIGLVGAQTLVRRYGCNLILTGRSTARIEVVTKQLREASDARVDVVELDLASLASVRAGAAQCKALLRSVEPKDEAFFDGIVCNAGIQSQGPIAYSADGYEETFAANCLGHFLLVELLLDSVADGGRIVWTASGTHDPDSMDGKTVGAAIGPDARALSRQGRDRNPISGGRRYATSKLCVILYAYELDRRLRRAGRSISSIAYDPGFLPDTGMGRGAPAIFRHPAAKFLLRKLGVTMGQMPLSGEALAMLVVDPTFADASGKYFQSKNGSLVETRSSTVSYDQEKSVTLWKESEILIVQAEISRS